jgi:penicillin-binding protein 2
VVSSDYRNVVFEQTTKIMSQMPMSQEARLAVMTGMEKCANDSGGTALKIFRDYPIRVAAKTGTAQTGMTNHSDNGAFVCYAPADNPQIAVVVYGERAGHGSSLGNVAKAVLDAYFGVGSGGDTLPGENQIS